MREIEQMHSLLFLSKFIHPHQFSGVVVRFRDKKINVEIRNIIPQL